MNNSLLQIEEVNLQMESNPISKEVLQEREGELLTIIEAIQQVKKTQGWATLKERIFDKLSDSFLRELQSEAKEEKPDTLKLNRIAGQLAWAERYADLEKLEDKYRNELSKLRLYGKTTKN